MPGEDVMTFPPQSVADIANAPLEMTSVMTAGFFPLLISVLKRISKSPYWRTSPKEPRTFTKAATANAQGSQGNNGGRGNEGAREPKG